MGEGADRFRNPDEDLPRDFDGRREEYYAAIGQPRDAKWFVETLRGKVDEALAALDVALRIGTADAESILRRFTKSNAQHPTCKALCELGKALEDGVSARLPAEVGSWNLLPRLTL